MNSLLVMMGHVSPSETDATSKWTVMINLMKTHARVSSIHVCSNYKYVRALKKIKSAISHIALTSMSLKSKKSFDNY